MKCKRWQILLRKCKAVESTNWRIMLDNKSQLSIEIMSMTILRDLYFLDLKYLGKKIDPLMHIEQFKEQLECTDSHSTKVYCIFIDIREGST